MVLRRWEYPLDSPDEGLKLETSAFESLSLRWPIYIINSVDKTKLFAHWLSFLSTMTCLVDLDEIVNRPPPEDDAIVNFALRIVLY